MPLMVRATLWLLVSVTGFAALVVPTDWAAKVRLTGEKLTGRTAVPERFSTCVPTAAESVNTTAPLMVPLREGLNVTAKGLVKKPP